MSFRSYWKRYRDLANALPGHYWAITLVASAVAGDQIGGAVLRYCFPELPGIRLIWLVGRVFMSLVFWGVLVSLVVALRWKNKD